MELASINLTAFQAKDGTPARVTIGGTTAVGKRVETYTVSSEVFFAAANRLLEPLLEDYLRQADSLVQKHLANLDAAKESATTSANHLKRDMRRLLVVTTGQQGTLPTGTEPTVGGSAGIGEKVVIQH